MSTDVSSPSAAYEDMRARWQQMRDCVEGSHAVKEAGTTYLPALLGQLDGSTPNQEYVDYKSRALFYNATGRTVDGLSGMVFRRPPVVELPPAADDLRDDPEMLGRAIEDTADAVLRELLTTGRVGVLVDHTRQQDYSEGEVGAAQPVDQRPYMALYSTDAILDAVFEKVGGARRLVQVRLAESLEVPGDDEFEVEVVQVVRVLELVDGAYRQRVFVAREEAARSFGGGTVTVYEERADLAVEPTMPDGSRIDRIPFWVLGTGAATTPGEIEPPPLLDLSDVNLVHYRTDADYRNSLHVAGVPTPIFTGAQTPSEPLKLGTLEGIWIEQQGATYGFLALESTGGISALKGALADLEQQMAFLGARMLQPDRPGVEAAETARIHRMGEISILARLSNVASNGLTAATRFMLEWAGIPTTDEHKVRLNDDFLPTQAPSQLLQQMRETWKANGVSFDSFWRFLQEGELVDPRRSAEEELAIIEEEAPEPPPAPPPGNGQVPPEIAEPLPPPAEEPTQEGQ